MRELIAMLEKATVRLGILHDRMMACDEGHWTDNGHSLSRLEIEGWVQEQREALAAATRVRVLDEWRVYDADGRWTGYEYDSEADAKGYADMADRGSSKPGPLHRVVRVALVDADSHQSVPSDHATRVTEEMVKRAIRVGRDYGYFDWDESGEERVAGMRAVLTAALEGPRD